MLILSRRNERTDHAAIVPCVAVVQHIQPEVVPTRVRIAPCFNFKEVDEKLFKELATLTKAGATKSKDEKFIDSLRKVQGLRE